MGTLFSTFLIFYAGSIAWATHRGFFAPKYARQIYLGDGDPVFCFTSVFAPTRLEERLYHVWQRFDAHRGEWRSTDRIGYNMRGGRSGGYRGVTRKVNVAPGRWRIIVETEEGKVLCRIPFTILERDGEQVARRKSLIR